ncbi:MAG TPA: glycoside hydrolase family 2 TIM barrel-domain containing protein, partial [Verrucomicrobiota bacterium]|nr:glycoside hydrolase family 2 TIM barrel-domain containing protein [Verrucomicrobiota bacterium]
MNASIVRMGFALSVAAMLAAQTGRGAEADSARERVSLDFGWKFHLGNKWGIAQNLAKAGTGSGPASTSFSDAAWRTVDLPHDWAIEQPFDKSAEGSHGFKALGRGFESNSVAWYRRQFTLPKSDDGKRIWLEFDGAFRDTQVFINGWYVGRNESGYSSFRFDITDVVNYGTNNLISVKVDATDFEGWFYEGAGIYRHVWLVKTAPLAIAPDGVFVYSKFKNNVPEGAAEIVVETRLLNASTNAGDARVHCEIINPAGRSVGKFNTTATVREKSTRDATARFDLAQWELWSPESPRLYKLITTIESGGKIVDRKETEFGIRTMAFDKDKGFIFNGKPYVIKGTCNHQDHAGVGVALPDRLQYFRIARLKEMGSNAYRAAHNPATRELIEACDRLGMLVMDECRLLGSDAANMQRVEWLIRRGRNHASV